MLSVGSLYGHGFDTGRLAELEKLGFAFRPVVSSYMGSQVCRFLDFSAGPSLELIEVTDRSDYESFAPPGMVPYCPGISLWVDGGSAAALASYERDFGSWEPYRLHVPYRAETGPDGPGWHYLNFAKRVVEGTFVWLTACDAPRPLNAWTTQHPNGVRGVAGLVFDVAEAELEGLARLAGERIVAGEFRIGGLAVTAVDLGRPAGRFPLRAVVLVADSIEGFPSELRSLVATRLLGRPAMCISTHPLSWDLWITTP